MNILTIYYFFMKRFRPVRAGDIGKRFRFSLIRRRILGLAEATESEASSFYSRTCLATLKAVADPAPTGRE